MGPRGKRERDAGRAERIYERLESGEDEGDGPALS